MEILLWFSLFVFTLALLIKASDFFIESSEKIGLSFGVSPFIIGITIVAFGTSLPELASSIAAVFSNATEVVVGNVVGSNITNILLVFGFVAVVAGSKKIEYQFNLVDSIFFLGSTILLVVFFIDYSMAKWEAAVMLLVLVAFLYVNLSAFGAGEDKDNLPKADWKAYLILVLSGIVIWGSASYNIESIIELSTLLNIPKEIIALGLVALGTSLPELFVSISAVKRNQADIALGNILGSNIFNVLAVTGIPGVIKSLEATSVIILFSMPILVAATVLFFVAIKFKWINKYMGFVLLAIYAYFIYHLIDLGAIGV